MYLLKRIFNMILSVMSFTYELFTPDSDHLLVDELTSVLEQHSKDYSLLMNEVSKQTELLNKTGIFIRSQKEDIENINSLINADNYKSSEDGACLSDIDKNLKTLEERVQVIMTSEEVGTKFETIPINFSLDPIQLESIFTSISQSIDFGLKYQFNLVDSSMCFEFAILLLNQLEIANLLNLPQCSAFSDLKTTLFLDCDSKIKPVGVISEYFQSNLYISRNNPFRNDSDFENGIIMSVNSSNV